MLTHLKPWNLSKGVFAPLPLIRNRVNGPPTLLLAPLQSQQGVNDDNDKHHEDESDNDKIFATTAKMTTIMIGKCDNYDD